MNMARTSRARSLTALGGAVLAALAVACGEGVVAPLSIPQEEWRQEPADVSLRLLAYDHHAGLGEARMVLRSPGEWADVWTQWQANRWPKSDPPEVDFQEEMVLLAVLGTRGSGGYAIAIDSMTETADEVVVHVRTAAPGENCVVTQALTRPGVAVAAPARSKPVRFVDRAFVVDCG